MVFLPPVRRYSSKANLYLTRTRQPRARLWMRTIASNFLALVLLIQERPIRPIMSAAFEGFKAFFFFFFSGSFCRGDFPLRGNQEDDEDAVSSFCFLPDFSFLFCGLTGPGPSPSSSELKPTSFLNPKPKPRVLEPLAEAGDLDRAGVPGDGVASGSRAGPVELAAFGDAERPPRSAFGGGDSEAADRALRLLGAAAISSVAGSGAGGILSRSGVRPLNIWTRSSMWPTSSSRGLSQRVCCVPTL
mmetsp:Transcript_19728/g.41995  ORF Transcript_19728/g.41995 Transcript_19728/m.41995 type:complete len:245 (+) Transcript_19728:2791-3525(+)